MKAWSNIEISPQDPEIIRINELEKGLGELSEKVIEVRELITRFEACHFKFRHHLERIKNSITSLEPNVNPTAIGINHIRHGESAWLNDTTGRSFMGQQYLWAIKNWLNDNPEKNISGRSDKKLNEQVENWLGDKSPDKIRLVRLIMARLTWDWKSHEELQHGGEFKDIELQCSRMDICHHAFPANIESLLQALGQMKPVKDMRFQGCGTYNDDIRAFIKKEFLVLNDMLKSSGISGKSDKNELTRTWLTASLAKTIKEQINLSMPLEGLGK